MNLSASIGGPRPLSGRPFMAVEPRGGSNQGLTGYASTSLEFSARAQAANATLFRGQPLPAPAPQLGLLPGFLLPTYAPPAASLLPLAPALFPPPPPPPPPPVSGPVAHPWERELAALGQQLNSIQSQLESLLAPLTPHVPAPALLPVVPEAVQAPNPAPALSLPSLGEVAKERAEHQEIVRALQHHLRTLGFDPGPSDGWFGPVTAAAVKRFQEAAGLPATGRVDSATWQALGRALASSAQSQPKPSAAVPAVGHPHARRHAWFFTQQPSKYNTNEDAPGNGNCGPASATMVLRAFGKINITAAEVDRAVEEMRRRMGDSQNEYKGTSIAGIVRGLKSYGMDARADWSATLEDMKRELAKGRMVIAHVVPTYLRPNATNGHYTVVTAIENGKVYLNDPSGRNGPIVISEAAFWSAVKKRGTFAMITAGP